MSDEPDNEPESYWKNVVGRLSSALDSSAYATRETLGFLKAQVAEAERARQAISSKRKGPSSEEAAQIQAMMQGLPQTDIDEITRAMASKNPNEAIAALKQKALASAASVPRPVQLDVELERCDLFVNDSRSTQLKVMSLIHFVNGVLSWLEQCTDVMDVPAYEEATASGKAVRQMGFIRKFIDEVSAGRPDPTRDMLRHIFGELGIDKESLVVDLVSQAAATMPIVVDKLFEVTGHQSESADAIRRWQAARSLVTEPDLVERAMVHLMSLICQNPGFRAHAALAFANSVGSRYRAKAIGDLKVFATHMAEYLGDYNKAVVPLVAGFETLLEEFEAVTPKAPKPAPKPA